jgi:hypothetical protein
VSAHPEDYQVAYEAGYKKCREDVVALLSRRGQELLVALICEALNTNAPTFEKADPEVTDA